MINFARELANALDGSDGRTWVSIARPNQLPPLGDWQVWVLMAGRGFGKTRSLTEFACAEVASAAARRIAVVGATASDCRDVLVEGPSGLLEVSPGWNRPVYEPSKRRVVWPNGAMATLFSAEESERLRGPQHDLAICDELATWKGRDAWDNLMFGLRLGRARCAVGTTPRPVKLLRELLARERGGDVVVTRGSTYENRANLAPTFFNQIASRYEGTRLGRQELLAELLEDTPGALWRLESIDTARRERAPDLSRIVIAIDPAVSSHEGSDETGIIVVGRDERGHAYVLEDLSGKYEPAGWARTAISAYYRHEADRIVAEVNNGGEMVENTLRTVDPDVSYTAVHASRGKYVRAEPIASLYEQGRVHHCGVFPEIEDQMTAFVPDLDRAKMGSPDRVDALVWGLTDLMIQPMPYSGLYEFYKEKAIAAGWRPEAADASGEVAA